MWEQESYTRHCFDSVWKYFGLKENLVQVLWKVTKSDMLCYGGHSTLTKHELSQLLHLVTTDAVIISRKITNDDHSTLVKTLVVTVCSVSLGDLFITGRKLWEIVITQGVLIACTCSITNPAGIWKRLYSSDLIASLRLVIYVWKTIYLGLMKGLMLLFNRVQRKACLLTFNWQTYEFVR